jgi:hypothetical protein
MLSKLSIAYLWRLQMLKGEGVVEEVVAVVEEVEVEVEAVEEIAMAI